MISKKSIAVSGEKAMGITKQYITIEHPKPLVAGEFVTVRFILDVGAGGMVEGGHLRVALPNPG
jgi:hypothetical protein